MKLHCKRAAAVLLALVMTLSLLPTTSLAAAEGANYTVTGEGFEGLVTEGFEGLEVKLTDKPAESKMVDAKYHHIGFEKINETHGEGNNAVYKALMAGAESTSSHYYVSSLGFTVNQPCYVVLDFFGNGDSMTGKTTNAYLFDGFGSLPDNGPSYMSLYKATKYDFNRYGNDSPDGKIGVNGSHEDDASVISDPGWLSSVFYLDAEHLSFVFMDYCLCKNANKGQNPSAYISNIRFYETLEDLPSEYKSTITFTYNPEHIQENSAYILYGDSNKLQDEENSGTITATIPIWSAVELNYTVKDGVSDNFFDGVDTESKKFTAEQYRNLVYKNFNIGVPNSYPTQSYLKFDILGSGDCTFNARTTNLAGKPESITLEYSSDGQQWTKAAWGYTKEENIMNVGDFVYFQTRYGTQDDLQLRLGVKEPTEKTHTTTVTLDGEKMDNTDQNDDGTLYYETTTGGEEKTFVITSAEEGKDSNVYTVLLWPTLSWQDAFKTDDNQLDELTVGNWQYDTGTGQKETRPFLYDPDFWNLDENMIPDPDGSTEKMVDEAAKAMHPYVFRTGVSGSYGGQVSFQPGNNPGILSFDYKLSASPEYNITIQYVPKGDASQTVYLKSDWSASNDEGNAVDWQHQEVVLQPNDLVRINYSSDQPNDDGSYGYIAISNLNFQTGEATITAGVDTDSTGKGSVAITPKSENDRYYIGQTLTFTATPQPGMVFLGWYGNDGQVASRDAEWTTQVTHEQVEAGTITYKAKFADPESHIAQVGEEFFNDLDAALQKAGQNANSNDKLVRLLGKSYTLTKSVTVPAGVTLLVPQKDNDPGFGVDEYSPNNETNRDYVVKESDLYYTLTVDNNATITVNGRLLVNAVTGRPTSNPPMTVSGGYGKIILNGNITVESGGMLDVCGYVTGSGSVTVKNDGIVRDLYCVDHWRGGSQAYEVFPEVFPINQFHMHNIETKTTIEAGGELIGTVKMNAMNTFYYTRFPQIGGSDEGTNALIRVSDGQVVKTYDPKIDEPKVWEFGKVKLELSGSGTFGSSALEIPILGMMSTAGFLYTVDGDVDYDISGTWNVNESFKFYPGAIITLKDGAVLTLAEKSARYPTDDVQFVLYDDATFDDKGPADHPTYSDSAYPDGRGDSQIVLEGGSTLNINSDFAGLIHIGDTVTEEKPAKITLGANVSTTVTTEEANGHLNNTHDLTFYANIDGWTGLTAGQTYTCWKEDGVTVIKAGADGTATQTATYGDAIKWADEGAFEYKSEGGQWGEAAPKTVGAYSVRKVTRAEGCKLVEALGTLTVKPLPVKIKWIDPDPESLVYDGQDKTVSAAVENKVGEDEVTVTIDKATGKDVGEYTSTVKELGGSDKDNYTLDGGENLTHTWNISFAARTDAPTVSADEPETLIDKVTITVTGLEGVAVEYSTSESGEYTALEGKTLEAEQDTTYYFRYKADANYTAGPVVSVTTGKYVAQTEATPEISNDFMNGALQGFGEGTYTVNGEDVTATDGQVSIKDTWFGQTVSIMKKGDGLKTLDSEVQELTIPARPEAPAASPSQASGASAEDGSITVTVETGKTYEYRKSTAETWTEVPEDGRIAGLSSGDYEVRVKGTETSFPGAAQKVTVSYYIPAPSVSGGGISGGTSSQTTTNSDGSTTTTTTRPDGSKTETTTQTDGTVTEKTTKSDGTVSEKTTQTDGTVTEKNTDKSGVVTETTTKPDNTVTEKVTQTDGSATERTTTPDGVVGQKNTDAEGKVTSAEVVIPKEAEKQDVVTAPVEVPASKTAAEAPEISVRTESTESKKVEIPVTEFGPGTVAIIVHEDGTEEVVRDCTIGENGVVLNVEGDVTLKIVDNTETFEDVEDANHWASNAVEFVAARELFNGTGENKFTPNGSMTRGMMVTVLYRLAYEPDAVEEGFADVKSDAYYSDAVAWAAENGVVNGYDGNTFAPDDNVSREQLVTILHRYAQKKGYATNASGTLANFADAKSVSSWASDAMSWAVELGLVNGTDASHISPAKSATRAEVATILMRFCEKVVK